MRKVLIMRGVSGSGKSTFTRQHPDAVVCSADAYFDRIGGYDATLIHEAHKACFAEFAGALEAGAPLVIVDNTHIEAWEISPLITFATYKGYEYEIVEIPLPGKSAEEAIAILTNRNLHGTPKKKIEWMVERFHKAFIPKSWNRRTA